MSSRLECKGSNSMHMPEEEGPPPNTDNHHRQLQTGKGVGADSYNGMFDCFSKIVRNEGYAQAIPRSKNDGRPPLTFLGPPTVSHVSTAASPLRS